MIFRLQTEVIRFRRLLCDLLMNFEFRLFRGIFRFEIKIKKNSFIWKFENFFPNLVTAGEIGGDRYRNWCGWIFFFLHWDFILWAAAIYDDFGGVTNFASSLDVQIRNKNRDCNNKQNFYLTNEETSWEGVWLLNLKMVDVGAV